MSKVDVPDVIYSFVEYFTYNLESRYSYKPEYIQICVGMVAKCGIKTWGDLYKVSPIHLFNLNRISNNVKKLLYDMREKQVWHSLCFATYGAFVDMHLLRYHTLLRKHLFGGHMFSWDQVLRLSNEDILQTKYLGPKTVITIGKLKQNKEFHDAMQKNYSHHVQIVTETGK